MGQIDPALLASELRVVFGQLVRRLRAENSLSLTHGAVLARIDRGGPSSASELAALIRVRPQSMAQTLNELERDGLIKRRPHPTDRRSSLVELTADAQARLQADRHHRESWLARAIEELSPAQQRRLNDAMGVLQELADS